MKQSEPLSFHEQALLREQRGWLLVKMVASGAHDALIAHDRDVFHGGTANFAGQRGWHRATKDGVTWEQAPLGSPVEHTITWDRIKAHVASVLTEPLIRDTQDLMERARTAQKAAQERRAAFQWDDDTYRAEADARRAEYKELIDRILPSLIDWEEESESLPSD